MAAYVRKTDRPYTKRPLRRVICEECTTEFETKSAIARFCSQQCARDFQVRTFDVITTCKGCGDRFTPWHRSGSQNARGYRQEYCGAACIGLAYESALKDARLKLIRLLASRSTCFECGKPFIGRSLYCSDACWPSTRVIVKPRPCIICETVFAPDSNVSTICSNRCRKEMKRSRRHARRASYHCSTADRISPSRLFERDGWMCQSCGCDLDPALRGQHVPEAPSVDHVIPLARGGTHSWGNVVAVCLACNWAKNDRCPEPWECEVVRTHPEGYGA